MTDDMQREVREITGVGSWLDWRRQDVTASRIAALFDKHPYLTRDQLAATMRGAETQPNAAMRRGRILEPAAAAAIAEDHPGWQIAKATTYHRLPEHRLGATPDYWLGDEALIQIKTVAPQEWEKWQGHVPLAYTLQTLTELLVTGRERGILAVMIAGGSFALHLFDVPRHARAERRILDAVAAWWAAFDAGNTAAGVSPTEIAADLDDGSHRDLSADNLLPALLPERAELKATVSAAERRLKEIDHEIHNRMGPARTGWLPGWSIALPTIARKEFTTPAGSYRRLDVKPTMETEDA